MIEPISSLDAKVDFLLRPENYPEPTQTIEAIETHMSWVFLTERFAYKLKKPAKTSFLDFSTLELRKHFCEEEVRLNRRLAPRVYIGTVAVMREDGRMSIDGHGAAVDWLVKMHRLPRERMLDETIRQHTFTNDAIGRFAERLIAFYRMAPATPLNAVDYRWRLERNALGDLEELTAWPDLSRDRVGRIRALLLAFLHGHACLLERRAAHIIEAHGDLRPEHVFLDADPQVIDCLEFNREFRTLDPLDELAFFAIECEMLGAAAIGESVFARYREEIGDNPPPRVFDFYRAYRAVLRAKLSIWHLREARVRDPARWPRQAQRYLELAGSYAERLS